MCILYRIATLTDARITDGTTMDMKNGFAVDWRKRPHSESLAEKGVRENVCNKAKNVKSRFLILKKKRKKVLETMHSISFVL